MKTRHYLAASLAGVLSLGGTAIVASSAGASPKAETDTLAVVGSGTSVVETLDEQGNANQETVEAGDSQEVENDSNDQSGNADTQEGNSGTNEDGSDNDSQVQEGDNVQEGDTGNHQSAPSPEKPHSADHQDTGGDQGSSGQSDNND